MKLMQFDTDLWTKTGKQVLRDLWIPAMVTLPITLFDSWESEKGWKDILGGFFTTLFFAGAYFNYVQRAKKLVIDERHHRTVVNKQDVLTTRLQSLSDDLSTRQENLTTRLEQLTKELAGHTTGGDAFAHVWFARVGPSSVYELSVGIVGAYAVQECKLRVNDFATFPDREEECRRTGNPYVLIRPDLEVSLQTLLPNVSYPVKCNFLHQNRTRICLHLNWSAKNGLWYQRLQLESITGKWYQASYVKRGEAVIHIHADDGYPKDSQGNPIFHDPP